MRLYLYVSACSFLPVDFLGLVFGILFLLVHRNCIKNVHKRFPNLSDRIGLWLLLLNSWEFCHQTDYRLHAFPVDSFTVLNSFVWQWLRVYECHGGPVRANSWTFSFLWWYVCLNWDLLLLCTNYRVRL